MATKGMTLVGLDVHARQTHAAVLAPATGELSVSKLGMPPPEVTPFLEGLGPAVQAVYEAGRPGSVGPGGARARHRRARGCAGVDPDAAGRPGQDRPPRRRAHGAALGRRRASVRVRAERRGRVLPRPGANDRGRARRPVARPPPAREIPAQARPALHGRGLGLDDQAHGLRRQFEDPCSQATFADRLAAVELLTGRRGTLTGVLEQRVPESSHAAVIARLRCFRGIDTLSAAGLCAEVGDFGRFGRPNLLAGFLGIVPSEYTSDARRRLGSITKARPRTPAGWWSRPPTTTATGPPSAKPSPAANRARTRA
jgi:transposase